MRFWLNNQCGVEMSPPEATVVLQRALWKGASHILSCIIGSTSGNKATHVYSKKRNMGKPTSASLSAGIQLWHISTEVCADWSRWLQAMEMWSRGDQNVLWLKIKPDMHRDPNEKNTKKKNHMMLLKVGWSQWRVSAGWFSAVRWSFNLV